MADRLVEPALARFESDLHAVILRRCPQCGAPHPGLSAAACDKCGAELPPPEQFHTASTARVTPNRLERSLLGMGAALRRLADKL